MLTRVEISGFKSFERLALDLQPFTVIAGPNASGKSNFFDALRLLSRLASVDLPDALRNMRGDPSEMFRRQAGDAAAQSISFAVEVLLDNEIEDAFGQRKQLTYTRVRYELEIERRIDAPAGMERLFVRREQAAPIKRSEDKWAKQGHISREFIRDRARYASGGQRSPFLETRNNEFRVNQDGVQGRPRPFPVPKERATATVLSKITTATEFPHLFALRQELESLTFLQLEVSAEREPSDALAPDDLLPDGSNIAKVLARIENETRTSVRSTGDLSLIRASLNTLVPGAKDIRVERDSSYGRYRLFITMKDGNEFSSRVLSDGTLRILALLTFLNDPRRKSVLLFEEPENGIHEKRLVKLVEILRESCSSLSESNNSDPLFQIILNTHSPVVLKSTLLREIVAVDVVAKKSSDGKVISRRSRMRTGAFNEDIDLFSRENHLSRIEVEKILHHNDDFAL